MEYKIAFGVLRLCCITLVYLWHSQLTIKTTPTGLSLSLSQGCPHRVVRDSLETFLHSTRSLPLLLQGMCASEDTLGLLQSFSEKIPAMAVTATTPSQIQITYDSLYPLSLRPWKRVHHTRRRERSRIGWDIVSLGNVGWELGRP